MGNILSAKEVQMQSMCAYNQHKDKWRLHAKIARQMGTKPLTDLNNIGLGKYLVFVATGSSLENHIDLLKEHRHKIDIFTCDKSLGLLIDRGIIPDFCLVADANVSFEKYCEPWIGSTEKIKLISNVCANPDWLRSWLGESYSFLNKDAINSEVEFGALSGNKNIIPASSNVSNAMIVIATQADEFGPKNMFGYTRYFLTGYDYSWPYDGNYYAFNFDGGNKRYYMNHMTKVDLAGKMVATSNNLMFSVRWLYSYLTTFNLPVFNCSEQGLLNYNTMKLKTALEGIKKDDKIIDRLKGLIGKKDKLYKQFKAIDFEINELRYKEV